MKHTHIAEEKEAEELAFWASPGAEFGEQVKQLTYMKYLGLQFIHDGNSPFVIDKAGLAIMDIGGGPVSLLLKTIADRKLVVDPTHYPDWVYRRYAENHMEFYIIAGERAHGDMVKDSFHEVWVYNVLQHVEEPEKIFKNIYAALKDGGVLRFVDWIDTPTNVAHPVSLTYNDVADMIFGASFSTDQTLHSENINENGAIGRIVYGIFKK